MSKTFKNIVYVTIQQFVNTILPFMTVPYIARVLGIEQNGVFSYTLTWVNLFAVVFSFGFAVHGTNIIAQSKGNVRDVKYLEIQVLRMSFLIVGLLLFFIFVYFNSTEYPKIIFYLQGLIILANFFDNSWYYQGTGEFKKIVTRNIIIKLVGTLSVFLFVKEPNDLWVYILLVNGSQLLGNIILFKDTLPLFRKINLLRKKNLQLHLKVSFLLFLPNVSVLIYSSFDKLLLGSHDITGLSNYQQVQRIIGFIYTFLMIPSPVLIQKVASLRAKKENDSAELIIRKGLNIYLILGLFLFTGIVLCSKEFIYLFLGPEYVGAIKLFIIISPVLIFKTLGGVIGGWYLIPLGKNKIHSFPLVIATLVSVVLNFLLTRSIGVIAATIIFVLVEGLVIVIQFVYSRKVISFFDKKNILIFICIFIIAFFSTTFLLKIGYINILTNNSLSKLLMSGLSYIFLTLIIGLGIRSTRDFIKSQVKLFKER
ncbi:oligosaccharide flippase family protein [Priestia megaterium]